MRQYKYLFSLFLVVILTASCTDVASPDANDQVNVRVENTSTRFMGDIEVVFTDEGVAYGDLDPGTSTNYRKVSEAFRIALITTTVEGKEVVLQPIDFVGESPLDPGFYTYRLGINEEIFNSENFRFSLVMHLRVDPPPGR